LQVNPSGAGSTTPPSGWQDSGRSRFRRPKCGYAFSSWSGSGSGSYTGTTNPSNSTRAIRGTSQQRQGTGTERQIDRSQLPEAQTPLPPPVMLAWAIESAARWFLHSVCREYRSERISIGYPFVFSFAYWVSLSAVMHLVFFRAAKATGMAS